MREKKILKNHGITLIALIVTIIVLLILMGVSIAMLTGKNGILTQAQRAKEKTEEAQIEEEKALENYEQYINTSTGKTLETITGYETTNTITQDSLENKIIVPSGFKVVNPESNVEDGIIIKDVNHEETIGSEFVWIPVGEIETRKGKITIELNRYTFEGDGKAIKQYTNKILDNLGKRCQELSSSDYGNIVAKNIDVFISKTNKSGGFYLGRYEARTSITREDKEDVLTQITLKGNDFVYNYITQPQAANLSRNMYNDNNFESDLVNSYAWDTALVFVQNCSSNISYSQKISVNKLFEEKGTNDDIMCNIHDIASNCFEWTTETTEKEMDVCCVFRGGGYANGDGDLIPGMRYSNTIIEANKSFSFRPILFL